VVRMRVDELREPSPDVVVIGAKFVLQWLEARPKTVRCWTVVGPKAVEPCVLRIGHPYSVREKPGLSECTDRLVATRCLQRLAPGNGGPKEGRKPSVGHLKLDSVHGEQQPPARAEPRLVLAMGPTGGSDEATRPLVRDPKKDAYHAVHVELADTGAGK